MRFQFPLKTKYSIAELNRLIQFKTQRSYSEKGLLSLIYQNQLAEACIYFDVNTQENSYFLNHQIFSFESLVFKKNHPYFYPLSDENIESEQDAKIIIDTILNNKTSLFKSADNETIIELHTQSKTPQFKRIKGFFFLPDICLSPFNLYLSAEDEIYLPESEYYFSRDLLELPNSTMSFCPWFIFMTFNHTKAQGKIKIAELVFFIEDLETFINQFELSQMPQYNAPIAPQPHEITPYEINTGGRPENQIKPLILKLARDTAQAYPKHTRNTLAKAIRQHIADHYPQFKRINPSYSTYTNWLTNAKLGYSGKNKDYARTPLKVVDN